MSPGEHGSVQFESRWRCDREPLGGCHEDPNPFVPSDEFEVDLGRVSIKLPRAWHSFIGPVDAPMNNKLRSQARRQTQSTTDVRGACHRPHDDRPRMGRTLGVHFRAFEDVAAAADGVGPTVNPTGASICTDRQQADPHEDRRDRLAQWQVRWVLGHHQWKGEQLLFLESKLHRKDHIQVTQLRWLMTALELGLSLENFVLVEWQYR